MTDVIRRISMEKLRSGKLRHILQSKELELDLWIRLYVTACFSVLRYGLEACQLDAKTCRAINAVNAYMLSHITGKSRAQRGIHRLHTSSFNILLWIRSRRKKWIGHIMRIHDVFFLTDCRRLIKQAVYHIFENQREGDLLMDVDINVS